MENYNIDKNQVLTDVSKVGAYAGGIIINNALQNSRVQPNLYNGKIDQNYTPDEPVAVSMLGTPVYSNLDLQGGTYTDNDGNTINYPSVTLDAVLFVVTQSKNIVITNIQGRNGSIKEYISDDDYNITITGIIAGGNNVYPKNEVLALKKVLDSPVAINVNSWFLNQFGVHSFVVKDYNFNQEAGRNSQQAFSISAISDVPVILQIR
jgi:hypothetical protein